MIDWESNVVDIGPKLFRYFSAAFPRPIASELVQETLLRLYRKSETGAYQPSRGSLRMFAFGIAHYVRLEAIKQMPPEDLGLDDFESDSNLEKTFDEKAKAMRLRKAIKTLSENERQVVLLYIEQDLTLKEIAQILGMPEGTVKSHLHRAKEGLKAALSTAEVNNL